MKTRFAFTKIMWTNTAMNGNIVSLKTPITPFIECQERNQMRTIDRVFITCNYSDEHICDDIYGYRDYCHYYIRSTGHVELGVPDITRAEYFAEAIPHVQNALVIMLSGKDIFTDKQSNALYELCRELENSYGRLTYTAETGINYDYKGVLRLDLQGHMNYAKIPEVFTNPKKPTLAQRLWVLLDVLGEKK
jgi:hypothetical protein